MHTVIETPEYLRDAKAAGLTDSERLTIVDTLARHPNAGDVIPGTGGARKVRFAGQRRKDQSDTGGAQRAARDSGSDCHHLPARSTTA